MLDFNKLIDIATQLNVPGLVEQGVALVNEAKAAADRAPHVLSDADRTELDKIHADALAAADRLDAALAEAEKR